MEESVNCNVERQFSVIECHVCYWRKQKEVQSKKRCSAFKGKFLKLKMDVYSMSENEKTV